MLIDDDEVETCVEKIEHHDEVGVDETLDYIHQYEVDVEEVEHLVNDIHEQMVQQLIDDEDDELDNDEIDVNDEIENVVTLVEHVVGMPEVEVIDEILQKHDDVEEDDIEQGIVVMLLIIDEVDDDDLVLI